MQRAVVLVLVSTFDVGDIWTANKKSKGSVTKKVGKH